MFTSSSQYLNLFITRDVGIRAKRQTRTVSVHVRRRRLNTTPLTLVSLVLLVVYLRDVLADAVVEDGGGGVHLVLLFAVLVVEVIVPAAVTAVIVFFISLCFVLL